MSAPTRIEYAVGLRFPEGVDTGDYDYLMGLPDTTPEKHELFAHLLLVAARQEWREADRMRDLHQARQRRADRRAARRR